MTPHEQIVEAFNTYLVEAETCDNKGVKAAATRERKSLGELVKLAKSRRAEIQDQTNKLYRKN